MDQVAMTDTGPIDLVVPADSRHLRLARLAASGVGADSGFSVDDVEELRLATGEASALLIDQAGPSARLALRFVATGASVVVEGRCVGDGTEIDVDPIAMAVLANTVDSFEVVTEDGEHRFRLVKRATSNPG